MLTERCLEYDSNDPPASSKGDELILLQLKYHPLSKIKMSEVVLVSTLGTCHLTNQCNSSLPKQPTEDLAKEPEATAAWKCTFIAWHFGVF